MEGEKKKKTFDEVTVKMCNYFLSSEFQQFFFFPCNPHQSRSWDLNLRTGRRGLTSIQYFWKALKAFSSTKRKKKEKQQRKTNEEYRSSQSIAAVVRSPPLLLPPSFCYLVQFVHPSHCSHPFALIFFFCFEICCWSFVLYEASCFCDIRVYVCLFVLLRNELRVLTDHLWRNCKKHRRRKEV